MFNIQYLLALFLNPLHETAKLINMKKTIIILVTIAVWGFTAQAQRTTPSASPQTKGKQEIPDQHAQLSVDSLDKKVGLTAEQKIAVYNLAITRDKSIGGIREKYKKHPDKREAATEETKATHKQYRQSVKKILTPEQINKLKEYHKTNKDKKTQGKEGEDLPSDQD